PAQSDSGQLGLSQWQQPDESAQQMESQEQPPSTTANTGPPTTGPFTSSGQVSRPPLLGEVLKQQQMDSPAATGNDTVSIDQSSSLSAAAADAMNTPVGNMPARALTDFDFGQGIDQGTGMTPQQLQQMIPEILHFMQNLMPTHDTTITAGPPAP